MNEFCFKLRQICQCKNKFEAFVDGISFLQYNPQSSNILLKILVHFYSILPDENLIEAAPLLLDSLARFSGIISFEDFYQELLVNGRENEISRFISAFEIKPSMLSIYKDYKFDDPILSCLIQSSQNPEYSTIVLDNPSLSSIILKSIGKNSSPFIISVISQISLDQLVELHKNLIGSGNFLESIISERINESISFQTSVDPFYLLDRAKSRKDWDLAARISEYLTLNEEHNQCMTKISGLSDISAKLLKSNLNSNEQSEILYQFSNQLEKSLPNQSFSDFSSLGINISERISTELTQIKNNRIKNVILIEDLIKNKPNIKPSVPLISSKCFMCRRRLGRCSVHHFPCGHLFHSDCLLEINAQILSKMDVHESIQLNEIGCPLCGLNSSYIVNCNVWVDTELNQFWSLNV